MTAMTHRTGNLPGKSVCMDASRAALQLYCAVCECVAGNVESLPVRFNLFGRPLLHMPATDLSHAMGFTATGLRAGIVLANDAILPNLARLESAVRNRLSLTLFAVTEGLEPVDRLAATGATVFCAATLQEALDLQLAGIRIAETSLTPVVVCLDATAGQDQSIALPAHDLLLHFAGSPDDVVASPTPAQQILFGPSRRRVPAWFNHDQPMLLNVRKETDALSLETAARQVYFQGHLDTIIQEVFAEYNRTVTDHGKTVTGTRAPLLSPVSCFPEGKRPPEYLVVYSGVLSATVDQALDRLTARRKHKVAAIRLVQIGPLPGEELARLFAGAKAITVVDDGNRPGATATLFERIRGLTIPPSANLLSARYGTLPSPESLVAAVRNMLPGGAALSGYWLELAFTRRESNFPKHEVLLQTIARNYPRLASATVSPKALSGSSSGVPPVPSLLRKRLDNGPPYARVSRFFDDTASLFTGDRSELVADPFQAVPVVPPSTALLMHSGGGRERIPRFHPEKCTGCADCALHCPHTAIHPVVLGAENLVRGGMAASASRGVRIAGLTPLVRNLARAMNDVACVDGAATIPADTLVDQAFEKIAGQMDPDGEKREAARKDTGALARAFDGLPLCLTDLHLREPETRKKGTGKFFVLSFDMDTCTGCGVCETACPDQAVTLIPDETETASLHRRHNAVREDLPDTDAETLEPLMEHERFNPLSAVMLSRHYRQVLNGSVGGASDLASKTMVRVVAAMAEMVMQPVYRDTIRELARRIDALSAAVHEQLGTALPSRDFDALAATLEEIGGDRRPFGTVIEKLSARERQLSLDTRTLRRRVRLIKSMQALKRQLEEGTTGTGRARAGFLSEASTGWPGSYPWNPFGSPAFMRTDGITPGFAEGLVRGQVRKVLDNIRLVRRADLELQNAYDPMVHDESIDGLGWDGLTDDEKALVPPLVLLEWRGAASGLTDGLTDLLRSGLPVKVILLDDARTVAGPETIMEAIAPRQALVFRSSLADPGHLFECLAETFRRPLPALGWLLAPVPTAHAMAPENLPKLYPLCLHTRAFPHFDVNPFRDPGTRETSPLSSLIRMARNPSVESDWMQASWPPAENERDLPASYALTWADWAFTLASWKDAFVPYEEPMGRPVPVSEYLSLSGPEREGKCPVVLRLRDGMHVERWKAGDRVMSATRDCARAWRTLKELGGEWTDHPEKLRARVAAELAVQHGNELADMRKEYETRIRNLEQDHLERIRVRLKEKLVQLSRKHPSEPR